MDLKRLRYFVTVVRTGSFTTAAQFLNMAQPPLSQRIQELEAEVGVPLLHRDQRPLTPTAAGILLHDQALHILQRTDALSASMRRLVNNERPRFSFGVVPGNFHGDLSNIIRRYRQALPNLDVRVLEMHSLEQTVALREGRIDAGISRIEMQAEGVTRILMRNEPMIVALPADHPLALREEGMQLAALKDEPFLLYTSNPRPSLAEHVLSQFRERGITLSNAIEVDQYDTALILIAAGCGVSIVPAAARLVATPGVAYRQLSETITCPILLCHRAGDASTELRTLCQVIGHYFIERGHALPEGLTCYL
ncbi:MAG: LysR family transcriptional regulator [Janthinobacterium lividum]